MVQHDGVNAKKSIFEMSFSNFIRVLRGLIVLLLVMYILKSSDYFYRYALGIGGHHNYFEYSVSFLQIRWYLFMSLVIAALYTFFAIWIYVATNEMIKNDGYLRSNYVKKTFRSCGILLLAASSFIGLSFLLVIFIEYLPFDSVIDTIGVVIGDSNAASLYFIFLSISLMLKIAYLYLLPLIIGSLLNDKPLSLLEILCRSRVLLRNHSSYYFKKTTQALSPLLILAGVQFLYYLFMVLSSNSRILNLFGHARGSGPGILPLFTNLLWLIVMVYSASASLTIYHDLLQKKMSTSGSDNA